MDIIAAIRDMNDFVAIGDYAEAAECARNIKRWIRKGGAVPTGYTVKELYKNVQ